MSASCWPGPSAASLEFLGVVCAGEKNLPSTPGAGPDAQRDSGACATYGQLVRALGTGHNQCPRFALTSGTSQLAPAPPTVSFYSYPNPLRPAPWGQPCRINPPQSLCRPKGQRLGVKIAFASPLFPPSAELCAGLPQEGAGGGADADTAGPRASPAACDLQQDTALARREQVTATATLAGATAEGPLPPARVTGACSQPASGLAWEELHRFTLDPGKGQAALAERLQAAPAPLNHCQALLHGIPRAGAGETSLLNEANGFPNAPGSGPEFLPVLVSAQQREQDWTVTPIHKPLGLLCRWGDRGTPLCKETPPPP